MARSPDQPIARSLRASVLRTVQRHALVARGGRVLVALSGGADSVALVYLLRELEADGEVTIAGLAHFNHQLRGPEADADEEFCRALAGELALPFEPGRGDVRALAREQKRSIEDASRVARYAFLESAADRLGAEAIAVAHSRDDQAETFLLRLLRGAGPRGLAGILPRRGRVVRPLIDIARSDLRRYVSSRGLPFREDATNADTSIPRNRIRHELIPYLEREFSQGIVNVLAREASVARHDEDHLQAEAIVLASSIVLTTTDGFELLAEQLTSLPHALATRVARHALRAMAPGRFIGYDQVERFLEFASGARIGSALSLPGQQATHRGDRITIGPEPSRAGAPSNSFRFALSIPGEVTLAGQGWAVSAELVDGAAGSGWAARGPIAPVAAAPLVLPLAVRSRMAGDRFRPLGLGGRGKKLQDFLVDRKIPREMRDLLPLVVDGADRIVWVVGESVAEDFRVTEPSRGVILLKARRLGGLG